jgi:TolA-binding protein
MTSRTATFMFLLLVLLFSVPARGAQESEIESLKQRINELEEQNRTILKALEDLRTRLEGARPSSAIQAAAAPAPAAPVAAKPAEQTPSSPDNPVRWTELTAGKSRMQFYGFLRLDACVTAPGILATVSPSTAAFPLALTTCAGSLITRV